MFYQSSIKKSSQSSLNSAPLRELVVTLNEQTEEFFSGGDSKDRLIGGLGDDRLRATLNAEVKIRVTLLLSWPD